MWDDKEILTCLYHFESWINCESDLSRGNEAVGAFITLWLCSLLSDNAVIFFILWL